MPRSAFPGGLRQSYLLVSAALLLVVASALAQGRLPNTTIVANPTTGRVAEASAGTLEVVPQPGVTAEQMRDLCHRLNVRAGEPLFRGGLWVITLNNGQTVPDMLKQFGGSLLVRVAEPDMVKKPLAMPAVMAPGPRERPAVVPNDTMWGQQWGPQKMKCAEAWDFEMGDSSVVVAICDTGIDRNHPDLAAHTWTNPGEIQGDGIDNDNNGFIDDYYGWDFHDDDNNPDPTDVAGSPHAHGTHCAGIASGVTNNGLGIAGVAWNASLMAVRVMGGAGGLSSRINRGIQYAADMGADVINLSLGGGFLQSDQAAIDYAYGKGVTICAAAGNDNKEFTLDPSTWDSPVCNDGVLGQDNKVIGVAASDQNDQKTNFSQYGGVYKFIDVSAPGIDILSTVWPGNTYEEWAGTSMACPHAVGLAALVISQIGPDKPQAVIDQIRATTDNIDALNPIYAGKLGTGRLNALEAVKFDLPPGPATAVNAFDTAGDDGGSVTVTWRKSPDDGAGYDDVIGYELWRGEQADPTTGTFERIADTSDLPAGKSGWIDTDKKLVNGRAYYYFVRTFDRSNQVDSKVGGPATPHDDLAPPAIDQLVAQDTQADSGRSITLSWVGYQGPSDLAKFRVYRSESEFTAVAPEMLVAELNVNPAKNINPRSYIDKAKNPDADPTTPEAQPLDQTDYWYAVTGVDDVGNEITAVSGVGPVQCAPNLSITLGFGLRMVSIPAVPIDPTPTSVLGISDPSTAEFGRWDALSGRYHVLSDNPADPFLTIVPGRGYWLERDVPTFIAVGGRTVEDDETEVPLEQGWNQVGSPYPGAYPFEGINVRDQVGTDTVITASNLVRTYGWRYDAFRRSYRLVSPFLPNADKSLPKLEGMWVYALESGVKVVFLKGIAAAGAETPAAKPAALDGWQIALTAETANSADTDNFLGVTKQADAIGTIVSPPGMGQGVDLYFPSGGERLAADLRKAVGARAKWDVVVECGTADTDVKLSWPDLTPLPNDIRPVLKDLNTGRSLFMRAARGYTYRSRTAGEQRKFEIICGGPNGGAVMTQMTAAPAKAGVEVTYTLARTANVTVEVRNLAGRLVATVPAGQGQVGLNRAVWNGQAAAGQGVPNGRYLICVTAVAADNGETARAVTAVRVQR